MKKALRYVFIALLLGLFGFTLFFLYQKAQKDPVVYDIQKPFYSDVVKKTVATGSVVPRKEIEIKPQVSGIVEELFVEPGVKVKEGDILAKIKIIPDMVTLNEAESRLERARLKYEDARLDHERQKKLHDREVISTSNFQKAQLAYNTAMEELGSAEDNLQLIREGVTKKSQKTTNTLIRSTIKGMVLDVPVKEGNSVIQSNTFNDGTTIAVVADMNDMIFEGKIDETEIGKVSEGMPLLLSIGAIENATFDASLEYISPKGKEENGAIQFEIRARVELRNDQFIRAGYSANADIVLDQRDSVMVISESLLKFEEDTAFVEILTSEEPQLFEKRTVKAGLSDGINIEILEGITTEDQIKGEKLPEDGKPKVQS